jgi:cytoskeletal protein CcmA (bactofilin family)
MAMAISSNKDRPLPGPGTIIGSNVVLTGILRDTSDIAIHGKVEGEVTSDRSVTIGETAEIKGPITGQIITIAGYVRGSVDAGQKLEILPTGKVYGSISTRELVIRAGALFVGKSTMPAEDESSPEAPEYDSNEKGEVRVRSFESSDENAEMEDE